MLLSSDALAERFEHNRHHLRAIAYRMLGARADADDAVQETWLRFSRADTSDVLNLTGWLATVTSRVCLDMLRSRKARREDLLGAHVPESLTAQIVTHPTVDEEILEDSVAPALLTVLDMLSPAERLAFVLHDMFAFSFDDVACIVGRSEEQHDSSRAARDGVCAVRTRPPLIRALVSGQP